jgi:hypothetical protein
MDYDRGHAAIGTSSKESISWPSEVICVSRRYEVTPLSSSATTISGAWTQAAAPRAA